MKTLNSFTAPTFQAQVYHRIYVEHSSGPSLIGSNIKHYSNLEIGTGSRTKTMQKKNTGDF